MNRQQLRNQIHMNAAIDQSRLSTCQATQVGAVIVKDKVIVSTGYNGVDGDIAHCNDLPPMSSEEHKQYSDDYEIHAEMNALMNALDRQENVKDGVVYCTHSPCAQCLKHLQRARIKEVIYKTRYWRITDEQFAQMQAKYPKVKLTQFKNDEE